MLPQAMHDESDIEQAGMGCVLTIVQAEPPSVNSGNGVNYYSMDTDAQHNLYDTGIDTVPWGSNPLFVSDNAEVLLNGTGLLFPRTYMMLFYRYDICVCGGGGIKLVGVMPAPVRNVKWPTPCSCSVCIEQ